MVKEPEQKPRRSVPALYETEQMGYIFTGDVLQPIQGRTSDLSNTLDGIIVPLTVSGQDIGRMQVQPSHEHAWTQEETNLLNAVASQASTQIQNLRLLEATERARAEAEAATRRFMHENWESYLDGINQSERIGYAYDQTSVNQFIEPPAMDGGIRQTVNVMEEHVGTVYVQPDPNRPMTNEDRHGRIHRQADRAASGEHPPARGCHARPRRGRSSHPPPDPRELGGLCCEQGSDQSWFCL